LGTVVALVTSPIIVLTLGWRAVFYFSGMLGFVWLAVWMLKAANDPEHCAGVSPQELAAIQADRPEAPLAKSIPWDAILREKHVWAIVIAHVCNNFGVYIILPWLPAYLHETFSVPMERLGSYSIVPWIAAFCVDNFSGWIADGLREHGMSMSFVRKLIQTTAFIFGAVPMLLLPSEHMGQMRHLWEAAAAIQVSAMALEDLGMGPTPR